jgi:integrase
LRGSVYYQTAELTKIIFKEGLKKEDKINPNHPHFQCVSSYKTMETYRNVWNNFGHYLKEHWNLKDFEQIDAEHIQAYFEYKIEYYPSKQYIEKLSSALGKLEIALVHFSKLKYEQGKKYNFNIRQQVLNSARKLKQVADGYHNRTYADPNLIISNLTVIPHRIAALIQLQGGARAEAVTFIKKEQLKGFKIDKITNKDVGVLFTKEKGGKEGDVLISSTIYRWLEEYFITNNQFKINYQTYANDIKKVCIELNIKPEGSHGFRWTFAQNRVRLYQENGYSYEQALQAVSWEMKHFRASITEHYLGG